MSMTDFDQEMMRRAVSLAQEARLDAPPNPWVGCVIVKEGKIVGEGFTQPPGKAHAEIMALQQAGTQAIDSEVYVTLEPCAHYGRTPPCTKALIAAGVSRVIVGIEDPDSNVKGKGIAQLKEAGIVVELGIQEDSIQTLLTPYLHHRKTGLPYCIAKAGMSLDGRIAAADGSSKWISSPEARAHAHQLRAESQAIMVGAGTALADQPQLTVRDVVKRPLRPPLRVVWDPNGKTTQASPLFDTSIAPTLMLTTSSCSPEAMQIWKNKGLEISVVSDLKEGFKILGKKGILQVLIEGGSTLLGILVNEKLINQLFFYVGNCILGDQGLPLFKGLTIPSIEMAPRLKLEETQMLGSSVVIKAGF